VADSRANRSDAQRTAIGLEQNTAALVSYLWVVPPVTGLILYLLEKENKFVRFHSLQSMLLGAFWMVAAGLLFLLAEVLDLIPFLGPMLRSVLVLAFMVAYVVVLILLMVKSFQGEKYKLPVIGNIAERNA
jgi:uncharacterized membrane protein